MVSSTNPTTVREAIAAGKKNLKDIPHAFFISAVLSPVLAVIYFFANNIDPNTLSKNNNDLLITLIGTPLTLLVLSFVWRSLHSATWKIWALENVLDVHRLYQVAQSEGMIFERNSLLNLLEFKTSDQRRHLAELEMRLDEPRQWEPPNPVYSPEEQAFSYSIFVFAFQVGAAILFFGFVYYMSNGDFPLPMLFAGLFLAGYLAYKWIPRLTQPAPIRFDETSLSIQKQEPLPWQQISDIRLELVRHGKAQMKSLIVETRNGKKLTLDITDLKADGAEVESALYEHWVRGKTRETDQFNIRL